MREGFDSKFNLPYSLSFFFFFSLFFQVLMSNHPPQQYGYYETASNSEEMDEMLNSLVGYQSHAMSSSSHLASNHYTVNKNQDKLILNV